LKKTVSVVVPGILTVTADAPVNSKSLLMDIPITDV